MLFLSYIYSIISIMCNFNYSIAGCTSHTVGGAAQS